MFDAIQKPMRLAGAAALAGLLLASACQGSAHSAKPTVWQPSPGHSQSPIWPAAAPDPQSVPGPETHTEGAVTNVTRPTMTVYATKAKTTGAAVVVFPGGGFQMLAIDLEGTEICDWLTSRGVTCVLLKYRVPSAPYVWQCIPRTSRRAAHAADWRNAGLLQAHQPLIPANAGTQMMDHGASRLRA